MLRLSVGNIFTLVSGGDTSMVWDILSYRDRSAEHAARYLKRKRGTSQRWDGLKSFFDRKESRFLSGLTGKVTEALKHKGVPFTIRDMRVKPELPSAAGDFSLKGIELRHYQKRTIKEFLEARRGVARLGTGAGKTEIAIAITKGLRLPTLFLTHRVNLLTQTAKRYASRCPELADQIGVLGGGVTEPKLVTIATVQTLYSLVKKNPKQMAEFLAQFRFLIIDEAHRSGAKQFYLPSMLCRNDYYRLSLTATPFMSGDDEADMYLMGTTGPIVTTVTNGELIAEGVLARPMFKFFTITEPNLKGFTNWRDIYERGIIYNVQRNTLIAQQAVKLTSMGCKTLVICREVAHTAILHELLLEAGVRAEVCNGDKDYHERDKALERMAKGKIDALIATTIFDEGIDVGEINAIILAAGTKSAPALFQRTGRAIRKKAVGGNFAIVVDFLDETHRILSEHSWQRYELVRAEAGFTII